MSKIVKNICVGLLLSVALSFSFTNIVQANGRLPIGTYGWIHGSHGILWKHAWTGAKGDIVYNEARLVLSGSAKDEVDCKGRINGTKLFTNDIRCTNDKYKPYARQHFVDYYNSAIQGKTVVY